MPALRLTFFALAGFFGLAAGAAETLRLSPGQVEALGIAVQTVGNEGGGGTGIQLLRRRQLQQLHVGLQRLDLLFLGSRESFLLANGFFDPRYFLNLRCQPHGRFSDLRGVLLRFGLDFVLASRARL